MRTFKITHPTILKKDSVKEARLIPDGKKMSVDSGDRVFNALAFRDLGNHYTISFDETVGKYNTWNIFKQHLQWCDADLDDVPTNQIVHPSGKVVLPGFPYYSQVDNVNNPFGACNVTSASMTLSYYGMKPLNSWQQFEDELYLYMQRKSLSRHSPYDLQKVINIYGTQTGIRDEFDESRTILDIQKAIDRGCPVIIHGYFTQFGHIVVFIGYTDEGFIVMDPYGEYWSSGYDINSRDNPNKGKNVIYSYGMISRLCSPEGPGHIYAHIISKG